MTSMKAAVVRARDLLNTRPLLAASLSLMAAIILLGAFALHLLVLGDLGARAGIDYRQYSSAAARWMSGMSFYQAWQLAGQYEIPQDVVLDIPSLPVLYPPTSLPLLIAGMQLGPLFWWGVPTLITAACWRRLHPHPWTWPFLTLCALSASSIWLFISGNPIMWSLAALFAATRWRWVAIGVLVKPSAPLVPFALFGSRHRGWWFSGIVALGLSLLLFPVWLDYITAVRHAVNGSLLYSLGDVPVLAIPLIAWIGRAHPEGGHEQLVRSSSGR